MLHMFRLRCNRNQFSMVVANGLMPMWCHHISKCHHDVGSSTYTRCVPVHPPACQNNLNFHSTFVITWWPGVNTCVPNHLIYHAQLIWNMMRSRPNSVINTFYETNIHSFCRSGGPDLYDLKNRGHRHGRLMKSWQHRTDILEVCSAGKRSAVIGKSVRQSFTVKLCRVGRDCGFDLFMDRIRGTVVRSVRAFVDSAWAFVDSVWMVVKVGSIKP